MNIYEASKKFGKIRRKSWENNYYIRLIGLSSSQYWNLHILIDNQFSFSFNELQAEDWEEYKEKVRYLTHKEAMQALIDGKKIYGKDYSFEDYLYINEFGFLDSYSGYECISWKKDDKYYKLYEG